MSDCNASDDVEEEKVCRQHIANKDCDATDHVSKKQEHQHSANKNKNKKKKKKNDDKWVKLPPFPYKEHSNFIMMNKAEFIALPYNYSNGKNAQKSDGLYKYNINENKWSLFCKFPSNKTLKVPSIVIDHKTNILYGHRIFYNKNVYPNYQIIVFNMKYHSLQTYHEKTKEIGDGASSVIINGQYHIIYGQNNNKHLVWNARNRRFKTIHSWPQWKQGNRNHGLVHIKSRNMLLLFGGTRYLTQPQCEKNSRYNGTATDSMWIYSIETSKWTKLKQKLPWKGGNMLYTLSNDDKYVILFRSKSIYILDLGTMIFSRSLIKAPSTKRYHVILTPQNEVHLIKDDKEHWKIKLEYILESTMPIDHVMEEQKMQENRKKKKQKKIMKIRNEANNDLIEQKDGSIDMYYIDRTSVNGKNDEFELKLTEENVNKHNSFNQQINAFQTEIIKLEQELLIQQQEIDKLTKCEKDLKSLNIKLLDEKMNAKQNCTRLEKMMNYKLWDVDDVYEWIINVDNCRYNKYSNTLDMNLRKASINGKCLEMMHEIDLHRMGITDFRDKKLLRKQIDELIKNSKPKDNELPICTICYNDLMDYVVEPCHHLYCKQCAVQYKECPKCRTVIKSSFQVHTVSHSLFGCQDELNERDTVKYTNSNNQQQHLC